jgi:cytochrome c553
MRTIVAALLLAVLPIGAWAEEPLAWAYPAAPPPKPSTDPTLLHVPGSTLAFTKGQIGNIFSPADWFPNEHPPMPKPVAHGTPPKVWACSLCHLPNGNGHPESASVSGMSASYIAEQLMAFRGGTRSKATIMVQIASAASPQDIEEASDYFAALPANSWEKVVEAATVPKSFVGDGAMRFAVPNGGTEPIGERIIALPKDQERAENRDGHSGFIDYVPPGSVKAGEALVAGGGKTLACAICHGPGLKGLGELPRLAGRSPVYIFRQLHDIQDGSRSGGNNALMTQVVERLDQKDMIAIAAYVATLPP